MNYLTLCATLNGGWKLAEDKIPLLADLLFDLTEPVDILIGERVFFVTTGDWRIPLGVGNIPLQESKLKWFVTWKIYVLYYIII